MLWQRRLFAEFSKGRIPSLCDLPTGMGKTSVIHLWWIALQQQVKERREDRLPTRLVYVVDRRTVVDQATAIAERIRENLKAENGESAPLSVSTLRGQFADNREWTVDPSRPAIIVGTVDMIGSRLLFSGYRSSFKMRPLDAGLLGQDTLLVLDEAHLSEPFAELIRDLSDKGRFQKGQGKPMRVMRMSATASSDDQDWVGRFKLESRDLEGAAETNPIIKRYTAKKWLRIEEVPADEVRERIAKAASDLAQDNSRVVVFVRSPDDATKIKAQIKDVPRGTVEVLTGTMRGLERDELLGKAVLKRFLDGEEEPGNRPKEPAILVCTSAGEVGFDLNADHMVCDAAPLDSMIQRLGRVNRRGHADATIRMLVAKPDGKQTEKPKGKGKKDAFESATAHAVDYLRRLRKREGDGTLDASPRAIHKLKRAARIYQLKGQVPADRLQEAFAPRPETMELTDILLDAWSMTTIAKPMPGRPPVAAWLRGIDHNEGPQTTIAWRAELDLDGFEQFDADDLEEWFDAHRILPHEVLTVRTDKAKDWMLKRWGVLPGGLRDKVGERHCVIDQAGLQSRKLKDLVKELERKQTGWIAGAQVVLPASFGGIERGKGLLDEHKPEPPEEEAALSDQCKAPDVADVLTLDRERFRCRRTFRDGGPEDEWLTSRPEKSIGGLAQFALDLPSDEDVLRQLVSFTPKPDRLEHGTSRQTLSAHVGLVIHHADCIMDGLPAAEETEVREAVKLAASSHDRGKNREIWQRAVGRKPGELPVGKSGGSMGRLPRGYRHEFGSLQEFTDKYEGDASSAAVDLAAHLIAAHHGRARPHFPKGGFDPDAPAKSPGLAVEVIRRFARLQRKYGYWRLAYLENLLRCADAAASAEKGK